MTVISAQAFAKVNLCLLVGGPRPDGRHELVTLLESVQLSDELQIVAPSPSGGDEVVCAAVSGPNLVGEAIARLRRAGWGAPPVRVEIEKRIPVAAGMGGGSADAAALLRCAPELAPVDAAVAEGIAAALGSDVPSQLHPGLVLGVGAGDVVQAMPELAEHALLVIPHPFELSTADVYREADRLALGRSDDELARLRAELECSLAGAEKTLPERLLVNDLQPAALSLRPDIGAALTAMREAGTGSALVCGSGPTVIGVFWGPEAAAKADAARGRLGQSFPRAFTVVPLCGGVGAPMANP